MHAVCVIELHRRAVHIILPHADNRPAGRGNDLRSDDGGDVDTVMRAPVRHRRVVEKRFDGIRDFNAAANGPDIAFHRLGEHGLCLRLRLFRHHTGRILC